MSSSPRRRHPASATATRERVRCQSERVGDVSASTASPQTAPGQRPPCTTPGCEKEESRSNYSTGEGRSRQSGEGRHTDTRHAGAGLGAAAAASRRGLQFRAGGEEGSKEAAIKLLGAPKKEKAPRKGPIFAAAAPSPGGGAAPRGPPLPPLPCAAGAIGAIGWGRGVGDGGAVWGRGLGQRCPQQHSTQPRPLRFLPRQAGLLMNYNGGLGGLSPPRAGRAPHAPAAGRPGAASAPAQGGAGWAVGLPLQPQPGGVTPQTNSL